MTVAVVGGGIFGLTCVFKLAELGLQVELFEMNGEILSCASKINQLRMHRGYHYPRSMQTAVETKRGFQTFKEFYGECLLRDFSHHYCIAKEDSLTSPEQFIKFCEDLGLWYEVVEAPDVIKSENVALHVEVEECMLSPSKLMKFCLGKLREHRIKVTYRMFQPLDMKNYDLVVNAAYSNQNYLLESYPKKRVDYQFEVVEKIVLKLPTAYRKLSVVVIDGPFTCIDPFGETGTHLMGNVEEAICSRNTGKYPEVPSTIKPILNKGIIRNPQNTKFKQLISDAERFFRGIEQAEHVGSMFTIRTVFPNREHDDARPTVVEKVGAKIISVFSGKIPTCVDAAERVVELV